MWTNLMEQIATEENLYNAWRKVRANKGAAGVDAVSVQVFEERLEEHLADLRLRLLDDTYYPLPLRRTTIPKRGGGERGLAIPTVSDRVAQRAFVNVLEPLFEEVFLDCSYGFRLERSVEHAVQAVLRHRQEGYGWILDADIERFFDTVDHSLLMEQLRVYVADRAVLRTVQMWLDVGVLTEGRPSRPVGSVSLLQATANYVRGAAQEVVDHLTGRDLYGQWTVDGLPYENVTQAIQPADVSSPRTQSRGGRYENVTQAIQPADRSVCVTFSEETVEAAARQQALRRFGRDAVLLAVTFRRALLPLLTGKALLVGGGLGAVAVGATVLGKRWLGSRSWRSTRVGTPQGSPLSPLLANVYLHPFDAAMTRGGLRLVRYADDFVVCCASELRARHAGQTARQELERLHLKMNEAKTRIVSCEDEFAFLGHLFDGDGAFSLHDGSRLEAMREVLDALKQGTRKKGRAAVQAGKRVGSKGVDGVRRFGETFVNDLKERWDEVSRKG